MDARTSTAVAVALVALGLAGYLVLEGLAAGLVLLVAGLLLVAVGVWGWQHPDEAMEPATARTNVDHAHEVAIVGRGALVAHLRDGHHEIAERGSTQWLRRLHDRAHAGSA